MLSRVCRKYTSALLTLSRKWARIAQFDAACQRAIIIRCCQGTLSALCSSEILNTGDSARNDNFSRPNGAKATEVVTTNPAWGLSQTEPKAYVTILIE